MKISSKSIRLQGKSGDEIELELATGLDISLSIDGSLATFSIDEIDEIISQLKELQADIRNEMDSKF